VRGYLAEFLSDPRVVKLPRLIWLPILYGIVLRTRPAKSAEKYAQIWTADGSPLAFHTQRQADLLRRVLQIPVVHAMRYGEPSIASALKQLPNQDVVVVPLYPQYAESTTESVADVLPPVLPPGMRMIREFHAHPAYIAALAANVRRHWDMHGRGPMLVMSFHGLPKRGSETYATQCRSTAKLLSEKLGLAPNEWQATFQSRFGYAEWLQPYTETTLKELASRGIRRADVVFPGFVADCLETLEEIGIGARRRFLDAGGEQLYPVPCLNESPEWIAALALISGAKKA